LWQLQTSRLEQRPQDAHSEVRNVQKINRPLWCERRPAKFSLQVFRGKAKAMFTLNHFARALGGEIAGRNRVLAPGPGHSPRDRSLAIRLDSQAPDGFLCHSFCGDDWRDCRDYVRQRLGLPDWKPGDGQRRTIDPNHIDKWDFGTIDMEAEDKRRTEEDLERISRAQNLWSEASDPHGTIAEQYLASRALHLHDDLAGTVLRFHPRTPWRNEDTGNTDRIPCLIAAFHSIDDDIVTAIHRIRLDTPARWPKTQRKMLGLVHRAAVKLAPATDELLIAEGVESAMAARELGVPTPAWALGSAGSISFFPVLDGVTRLRIHAEPGEASERAVRMCKTRWRRAGRKATAIRSTVGSDLNDALMAVKTAAAS
jgi:hypothetical protein